MPTPPDTINPTQRDTNGVVEWVGYHLIELAGVTVPAVLGVTVSPVFTFVAILVAAWWALHEWRLARRRRAARRALCITAGTTDRPVVEQPTEGEEASQVTA
ncbi:MAG TPA: hypothetical protein VHX38_02780 [Pseudonocardiaceae bacterium]|jgi:hypothetical protein|nr:hypothetical protein [Pseudonocardiaceae bacterium]